MSASRDLESRRPRWADVCFQVELLDVHGKGSGTIESISASGAIIFNARPALTIGSDVRLKFALSGDTLPIEIRTHVLKEAEGGIELEFIEMSSRTRKLVSVAVGKALRRGASDDETPTLTGPDYKS